MKPATKSEPADTGNIVWTLTRRLAMVIVLALAFILSAAVTIYIVFRGGNTRVPDVLGKSETDAKRIIESGQLEFRVQRRNDDSAPMNTVIETRPSANSAVKKNSVVTVVISNGPGQTKSQNFIEGDLFLVSGFRLPTSRPETGFNPTSQNLRPSTATYKLKTNL